MLPSLFFDDELPYSARLAENDIEAIGLGTLKPHLEILRKSLQDDTENSLADLFSLSPILVFFKQFPIPPICPILCPQPSQSVA
jgi:hypothetical protein